MGMESGLQESKAALHSPGNINTLLLVTQKYYSHYNFVRLVEKVIVIISRKQEPGVWRSLVEAVSGFLRRL